MNNFYDNITEKKFKILTILTCFFGDFTVLYWIWGQKSKYFSKYMSYVYKILEAQGHLNIPRDLEQEVYQLMTQSMLIMFTGIMMAHGIIYLTHWFNRKFSRGYIKLYSATAILGCFTIFIIHPLQNLHFVILTFFYAIVFFGLIRKKEQ